MTIDLAGRIVLVTGGTRGVGAGIARTFMQAGATVEVQYAPGVEMLRGTAP
ncbi:hypothetical protein [Actinomadura sp. GC306]|uniref:hypothetical protein n=1 Tax=Actinomadura sp. GC306 TaxID=2530367 RepID=UPI001A9F61F7|nr:hypothetical protein [Actinomadura sp. GC306]